MKRIITMASAAVLTLVTVSVLCAAGSPANAARSCGEMKNGPVGSYVETDEAKVVTWPQFAFESDHFYIQDDNRAGGVKVIPADPNDVHAMGTRVSVQGTLNVVDGEVAIIGAAVAVEGAGEARPVAMAIRGVGGAQTGIQPATDPARGPTNVGLLVRITGIARAYIEDDDSTEFWFTIDDGSGARTEYLSGGIEVQVDGIKVNADHYMVIDPDNPIYLTVTGVSSVEPEFGNQRQIRVRDPFADVVDITP